VSRDYTDGIAEITQVLSPPPLGAKLRTLPVEVRSFSRFGMMFHGSYIEQLFRSSILFNSPEGHVFRLQVTDPSGFSASLLRQSPCPSLLQQH